MAKVNAFREQWEKDQAGYDEHNRKVDEYMAERKERQAAREERRRIKEEKRAEKRAAKEERAAERLRLQRDMAAKKESTAEILTEKNDETRTIVPENSANDPVNDNLVENNEKTRTIAPKDSDTGSDTYLVEQQVEPSSAEPSNRTYTIEKAPESNDSSVTKSPGVSRTINSSEISVFSPKEKSTPIRAKEVFQKPKKPTKLAEKVKSIPTPEIREANHDPDSNQSGGDTYILDSPELMIDEERALTSDDDQELVGNEQKVVETTSTQPEKRKRGRPKRVRSGKRGRPKKVLSSSPTEGRRKKKGFVEEASSKKDKSFKKPEEEKIPETPERPNLSHSELDPGIIEASLGDKDVPVFDDQPPVLDESDKNVSESDDDIPLPNKTKKGRRKSARFSLAPDEVRTFNPDPEEHPPKRGRQKNAKKEKRRSVVARDEIRQQRCESPDASILLDHVIEPKTPPVGVRRSRRIRFLPNSRPPTNDLRDIQPMLTEDQIKKGDFGFIKEIDLHRQMPKKINKNDPFSMSKFERMKLYSGLDQGEPCDEIWAEAKLSWEIGTVARAEDVVEREDGKTYTFLSSEKNDKWRFGCAPGAKTNLAIYGVEYGQFYIKTKFTCSSMGLSQGSLLFSQCSLMQESTGKNEFLTYNVLYGEIKLRTDKEKVTYRAGESFNILPNTKDYELRNTRQNLTELEWELITRCDFSTEAASELSHFESTTDD